MKSEDIQDEMCTCGHLKSEHADLVDGFIPDAGECEQCDCVRFTWESFIFKEGVKE